MYQFLFYCVYALYLCFMHPLFPIMWLWLVCLKTCLRLVKHEGSDIAWPLVFLGMKKIKFPRIYRFLLHCDSGSSGLSEVPLQKLKMVDHEPCPHLWNGSCKSGRLESMPCQSPVHTMTISVNILIFFLLRQKRKNALLYKKNFIQLPPNMLKLQYLPATINPCSGEPSMCRTPVKMATVSSRPVANITGET